MVILKAISRSFCSKSNIPIMKYLNVAEKNDAAKNISAILSRGNSNRREGFSKFNKIYEFNTQVLGQNSFMVMTSVSGHLLNYEFIPSFQSWKSCSPLELFDAPITKICSDNYQDIKRTLEREIRSCDGLIIWTDCDREGENIGYEIIQVCSNVKPNLQLYRAKFSEITAVSVFRALNNLGRPNKNISDAVDVRQELDLRTGAAFTRLQTMRYQKMFPRRLANNLISYGSCQFPTLGFVVERQQAIEEFIAEPFWKIKMCHRIEDLNVEFNWKRDRLFDRDACEGILNICLETPLATIDFVEGKPKSKWRPLPLDTVEMEKNISRKLRINAKDTMKIAEKLYTQGLVSYPRTETNIFPKELNLAPLVEQQCEDNRWGQFARNIFDNGGPNPRQGQKSDQAHPPIHPTKYTNTLTGNEQKIYEYIVRHFLACVSKDAQGFETIASANIAGEKFVAKGLMILEKNYLEVYTYDKWNAKEIHQYRIGDSFTPTILEMIEGTTTAPQPLTEADLIALMEKHGIGTDATHADHIDTIKSRGYVTMSDNRYFAPSTLGIGFVEGYNNVGLEVSLAKPNLRAEFESDLKLICDGAKNPDAVKREQVGKYKAVFQMVLEKLARIDESLTRRLGDLPETVEDEIVRQEEYKPVLKCPKCSNDMVVRCKKNGVGKYLSCIGYPGCKNVVWFSSNIENIQVLDESCPTCGPNVKMVRIKFKQNLFPADPNPNTFCIGGCNRALLEDLDVSLSSVRKVNAMDNVRPNNINVQPNLAPVFYRNRTETSFETRDNPPTNTFNYTPGPSTSNQTGNTFNTTVTQEVLCSCNQEAVILTVRKDGPNKGRKFYKCRAGPNGGGCNFFQWADDTENNSGLTDPRRRSNGNSTIMCNCPEQAVQKTVMKDGPNKGRPFYCCPKPMGQGCKFFKWADEPNETTSGGGGDDDGNDGPGDGGQNPSLNFSFSNGWRNKRTKGKAKNANRAHPYNENGNKNKRKCGLCREEGHTRNKCPNQ